MAESINIVLIIFQIHGNIRQTAKVLPSTVFAANEQATDPIGIRVKVLDQIAEKFHNSPSLFSRAAFV
jgi:hypothetical protein